MNEVLPMTFDESKKELKSYQLMERTINQLESWIADKKESANKLTSVITAEPRGSPKQQDGMAEKLTTTLDIEAETQERIKQMKEKQRIILNKVLKIEEPYQNVLFSIYIVGTTVEASSSIVGYCRTETYKKRDKGIEMYAKI